MILSKYFVIVFVLILCSSVIHAQNIQTASIEWHSSSTFDAVGGVVTEESTKVTTSSEEIVWYASNGQVRKTFTVTGLTGSWTDVDVNGSVIFNLTYNGNAAIANFSKNGDDTRIRIHLLNEEGSPLYELTVTSLTIN